MKKGAARDGLYQRGETWYFRRMVNGKRIGVSTHCKDRQQAERRKVEIENAQNEVRFGWQKPSANLEASITEALNRASAENASNTPDFILAQFLLSCLDAWNTNVNAREQWYGRKVTSNQTRGGLNAENE